MHERMFMLSVDEFTVKNVDGKPLEWKEITGENKKNVEDLKYAEHLTFDAPLRGCKHDFGYCN